MNRLFLSCSFRPEDRDLVATVDSFLKSYNILPVLGNAVGGEVLTPAVMARIEECDGLIALATARNPLPSGKFSTHAWVRDELNHARSKNIPAIAMVPTTVDLEGAYQENERIEYDPANLLPAFLKIGQTIGIWKQKAGRKLQVRILPETLGKDIGAAICEYRFTSNGRPTAWQTVNLVRAVGGTVAWLNGAQEDSLVELRVKRGAKITWSSIAVPQWVHVKLNKEGHR